MFYEMNFKFRPLEGGCLLKGWISTVQPFNIQIISQLLISFSFSIILQDISRRFINIGTRITEKKPALKSKIIFRTGKS